MSVNQPAANVEDVNQNLLFGPASSARYESMAGFLLRRLNYSTASTSLGQNFQPPPSCRELPALPPIRHIWPTISKNARVKEDISMMSTLQHWREGLVGGSAARKAQKARNPQMK